MYGNTMHLKLSSNILLNNTIHLLSSLLGRNPSF